MGRLGPVRGSVVRFCQDYHSQGLAGRVTAGQFVSPPIALPAEHRCRLAYCERSIEQWFVFQRCWRWLGAA